MAERKADMTVKDFIRHNYRHFNAAVVVDASEAYIKHLASGGEDVVSYCRAGSAEEAGLTYKGGLRERSKGLLGGRGMRKKSADFHARLGRLDAGKYFCRQYDSRRGVKLPSSKVRPGTDGGTDRLVSPEFRQGIHRLLPDCGRHRGGLPHLRG